MRTIGAARDARLTSVLLVAAACSVAPAKEPSITGLLNALAIVIFFANTAYGVFGPRPSR